jgi:hypothetical protein
LYWNVALVLGTAKMLLIEWNRYMMQILPCFDKLRCAKLLTASLVLAMPLAMNPYVFAQPDTAPTSTVSQPAVSSVETIQQKLLGQWQIQDPSLPVKMNLIFTPEGKMFLIVDEKETALAVPFEYRIDTQTQPMQIDVTVPDYAQPVQTIFDFTADGQLKLQIDGTDPGNARPKDFSAQASLFKKISDEAKLPTNVNLYDAKTTNQSSKQVSVGQEKIESMNRAQQNYYLKFNKFARTIDQLEMEMKSEDENYRYRISMGRRTRSVIHTATAKKPGMKSYTGIVFLQNNQGELLTQTNICETVKPATKAPAPPKIPKTSAQQVKCPAGSILLK